MGAHFRHLSSKSFSMNKELFDPMDFDPWNLSLKFETPSGLHRDSIGTPIPKVGAHLGVWGFIPSHSPTLLGTWNVTPRLHSWPAPSQALALVASPRLRLQHKKFLNWYNHSLRGNKFIVEYWSVRDQNQWKIWTTTRDIKSRSNKRGVFNNKMKRLLCQIKDIVWKQGSSNNLLSS